MSFSYLYIHEVVRFMGFRAIVSYKDQAHIEILTYLSKYFRHYNQDEFSLSLSNRWENKENYCYFWRYVMSLYTRMVDEWDTHLKLIEFSYNNSYYINIGMTSFEALYDKPYRSLCCWFDIVDWWIESPFILQKYVDQLQLIKDRLRMTKYRQKYYTDHKHREFHFEIGDVFLMVSLSKGISRFGKKDKLDSRYIGPFEILERIGTVAYRLELLP